jgi:hypothetical protein
MTQERTPLFDQEAPEDDTFALANATYESRQYAEATVDSAPAPGKPEAERRDRAPSRLKRFGTVVAIALSVAGGLEFANLLVKAADSRASYQIEQDRLHREAVEQIIGFYADYYGTDSTNG